MRSTNDEKRIKIELRYQINDNNNNDILLSTGESRCEWLR